MSQLLNFLQEDSDTSVVVPLCVWNVPVDVQIIELIKASLQPYM
jgi:hypothetical protein